MAQEPVLAGELLQRIASETPPSTEALIRGRNIFWPEDSNVQVGNYQRTRLYKVYQATDPDTPTPRLHCAKTTFRPGRSLLPYLGWLSEGNSDKTILVIFDRLSSRTCLTATKTQFDELASRCPSRRDLESFVSLFVDDFRSVCYPSPVLRQIETLNDERQLSKGFELLYGLPYFEVGPRSTPPDFIDWPLRRCVIYHRHLETGQGLERRSLWILLSAQQEVENALLVYLKDAIMLGKGYCALEPHFRLQHRLILQWRPPIIRYAISLRNQFNRLLPEAVGTITKKVIDQAWEDCLQRTDMADYIAEFVLAAVALKKVLRCLHGAVAGSSNPPVQCQRGDLLQDPAAALLNGDIEEAEAIYEELRVLQSKAERIATANSRLTELRSEDFNHTIQEMKSNTKALKQLNQGWEEQSDKINLQNHINSNVSRFLSLLAATLLPVGLFGSFFGITKIVGKHNWWWYWVAVVGSWLVMVLFIYLWGRQKQFWVYGFWMTPPLIAARRYTGTDIEEAKKGQAERAASG